MAANGCEPEICARAGSPISKTMKVARQIIPVSILQTSMLMLLDKCWMIFSQRRAMKVEIANDVRSKLYHALMCSGRREIGGVLMGEQIEQGHFRIVDISIDSETGGRAHFVRSPGAHAVALEAFFQKTGNEYSRFNYLGEWHSHPAFSVAPSSEDISSMVELVHGERGIDFAVLLIVRLHHRRAIASSCTLFCRNMNPSSVEILPS